MNNVSTPGGREALDDEESRNLCRQIAALTVDYNEVSIAERMQLVSNLRREFQVVCPEAFCDSYAFNGGGSVTRYRWSKESETYQRRFN